MEKDLLAFCVDAWEYQQMLFDSRDLKHHWTIRADLYNKCRDKAAIGIKMYDELIAKYAPTVTNDKLLKMEGWARVQKTQPNMNGMKDYLKELFDEEMVVS